MDQTFPSPVTQSRSEGSSPDAASYHTINPPAAVKHTKHLGQDSRDLSLPFPAFQKTCDDVTFLSQNIPTYGSSSFRGVLHSELRYSWPQVLWAWLILEASTDDHQTPLYSHCCSFIDFQWYLHSTLNSECVMIFQDCTSITGRRSLWHDNGFWCLLMASFYQSAAASNHGTA